MQRPNHTHHGRLSIIVAPGVGLVKGPVRMLEEQRVVVSDRAANGEGFTGERALRLPRRIERQILSRQRSVCMRLITTNSAHL